MKQVFGWFRKEHLLRGMILCSIALTTARSQEIVSTWLPGTADVVEHVLDEVRRLESQGRIWDVRVAQSFPVRIHVTGPFEVIQPLRAAAGLSYFVTIGEALTSNDKATGIVVGYRLFSAPTFSQYCDGLARKLTVHNTPLVLAVGGAMSLDEIVITAEDDDGRLVPDVPIRLDAEVTTPPVIDLRQDRGIADGKLIAVETGGFGMRAQTICLGEPAVVTFAGSVQPRHGF